MTTWLPGFYLATEPNTNPPSDLATEPIETPPTDPTTKLY